MNDQGYDISREIGKIDTGYNFDHRVLVSRCVRQRKPDGYRKSPAGIFILLGGVVALAIVLMVIAK